MGHTNDRRARPLTFEMMAPVVRDSRLAAAAAVLARLGLLWVVESRVWSAGSAQLARLHALGAQALIAHGAWVVAVAAATNLVMLTVVERYHFPRPTAGLLPAALLVGALVALIASGDLARAFKDKREP